MAKIQMEPLPPPAPEYTRQQQANLIRILQLTIQRIDYSRESDAIARIGMNWIGL